MSAQLARIMFAAPASGCGKTVVTCAVLKALSTRGLECAAFKCGPDFIDPLFHRAVMGIRGGNLDTYFLTEEKARAQFDLTAYGADISVIEGVMGYYDGLGGVSDKASSWDVAMTVGAPVILVVDGKKAGLSLAALVKGFLEYRKDSGIRGVILNRVSENMADRLKKPLKELGIEFCGFLPDCREGRLESRHLGLKLPGEEGREELIKRLEDLAALAEKYIDLDKILDLARSAKALGGKERRGPERFVVPAGEVVRIGVASDEAFCFYYQENLALLEELGAVIETFSPLRETRLPKDLDGLILGGGYPEVYAKALSANESMRKSVKDALASGLPALAECGGFLYLHDSLQGEDGEEYEMAGVIPASSHRTGRLTRFGYAEFTAAVGEGCLDIGQSIKGHEFHYWDSEDSGDAYMARKPVGGGTWPCIHVRGNLTAGFPHLYYPSNPDFAMGFLRKCRDYSKARRSMK